MPLPSRVTLARWLLPVAARAPFSLLAALVLVRFADEWFTFFPAGALEPLTTDLDLSYAQGGLILAALSSGGLLGHGFTVAADFVDRRLLASLGAAAYGLCMLAFALGESFWVLLVAAFLWGAASDAFVHGTEVALVDLYRDDLAPALGRVNAYGSVGDVLGPLTLAAVAATGLSWRAAFAFGAGAMLLYAVWLARQRFPRPQRSPDAVGPVATVLAVARDRRIIMFGLAAGLFSLLDEPFLGFTVAYLERVRDLSASTATLIITVAVAAGVAGFLAVPLLTRRASPRTLLLLLNVLLAASVALLIVAPVVPLQLVAAAVFGFVSAAFWAVLQAAFLGLRPGEAGTSQAVISTIELLGVGFPALVGAVADAHGLTAGLTLYAAIPLAILPLLLLVTISTDRSAATDGTENSLDTLATDRRREDQ